MAPHQHTDQDKHDKCSEVFAMLSDYLNLELPRETCREIEAHIAGCEPCVEFAESLRKTVDLCRKYEPTELPAPMGEQAKAQLLDAYKKMLAARRT
jgi:RNA polymerase sigma-70 factor (ECF subfamily)